MNKAIYRFISIFFAISIILGGYTNASASTSAAAAIVTYFDDQESGWKYTGTWTTTASALAYKGMTHTSNKIGNYATFQITGSSFTVLYTKALNKGKIDVFVDNTKFATLDQNYISTNYKSVWNSPAIPSGTHVIKVVHTAGKLVDLDALKVTRTVANYSVDANIGSDANPGSLAKPWKTIQKAANTMLSSDTVTVQPGNYPELVYVKRSGNTFTANGLVTMGGFYVLGSTNIVRGFTISNPASDFGIRVEGNNNLIDRNEISNTMQDGIWFFGSGNKFTRNYIHDIVDRNVFVDDPHADCFQTWGPAENITFEKNFCNHTSTSGSNQITQISAVKNPVRNITFKNNLFIMNDPGYSPMNFNRHVGEYEISNMVVINNTFIHKSTGSSAIRFTNITGATAINNLFVNFGYGDQPYILAESGTTGTNFINNAVSKSDKIAPKSGILPGDMWQVDPSFVDANANNFHLAPTSALINRGMNMNTQIADDYDGILRPQGGALDIGAFEFKP
jgi:hypothetical protein